MPVEAAVAEAPIVAPVVAPAAVASVAAPVAAPAITPAPVVLPVASTPPVAIPVIPAVAETVEVQFDATGDPGLDVALGFMGKLGLSAEHPAMAAAINGDFGMLKATLATMGDKSRGWEQMVALGEDAFARQAAKATELATKTTAAVHSIAGGEAQWNAVQSWAKDNASPEEKAEINKLFDSGIFGARAAALLLTDKYRTATGTVVQPGNALRPGASTTPTDSNARLSAPEYAAAVRVLHQKMGNAMDASPEYAALRARLR